MLQLRPEVLGRSSESCLVKNEAVFGVGGECVLVTVRLKSQLDEVFTKEGFCGKGAIGESINVQFLVVSSTVIVVLKKNEDKLLFANGLEGNGE